MMINGTDLAKKIGVLAEAKKEELESKATVGITAIDAAKIEGYADALNDVLVIMATYAA